MLEKQMDNKQIRCMLKIIQGMTTVTIELQGLLRNHIHRESKKNRHYTLDHIFAKY